MTGNGTKWETPELAGALRSIRSALPPHWSASIDSRSGTVAVASPSGQSVLFKSAARIGSIPLSSLEMGGRLRPLYVAEYIAAPTRAKLERAGVSYADATGWVRIVSDDPMLAITTSGAVKPPRPDRETTAITRLDGRSAGRIVRALTVVTPPAGVRELAILAEVSAGTVSKTLPTLVADGAVQRDDAGRITAVNRRQLLARWTIDYQVLRSNGTPGYSVAPRGLDNAQARLASLTGMAVTGASAGQAWLSGTVAPVIPVTQIIVYAIDPCQIADALGLVPVEPSVANVTVLTPQDPVILDNPEVLDGMPVAPLAIVLADLLTLPGRYPQQAEALMDTLAKTDPNWRSR
ncbi:MAG: hypothetical protein LBI99_05360 [Propionibacteriaceae bacterium]|nr:hypothetical protein [Propionibacteriaceae bacterium]